MEVKVHVCHIVAVSCLHEAMTNRHYRHAVEAKVHVCMHGNDWRGGWWSAGWLSIGLGWAELVIVYVNCYVVNCM